MGYRIRYLVDPPIPTRILYNTIRAGAPPCLPLYLIFERRADAPREVRRRYVGYRGVVATRPAGAGGRAEAYGREGEWVFLEVGVSVGVFFVLIVFGLKLAGLQI